MLDVGCGNGVFLKDLVELGYTNLHGVDYSEPAVEICRALLSDPETGAGLATLVVGSLAELPFPDGTFTVRRRLGRCSCYCW